eukprot:CAMPEP_0201937844 /NCGR_PEP_ID=MMETSP0903-20130614/40282_1 /ASSEMBLY_ACC=CAM_ASM_000552 /TAXON_ID=420261 /ORGANISM="Thalassiosira antarctica, Strain CCMP982" /LENGTH=35 /DNA_ID= /DNA_START= /DNA_END= /DNA_ORIENTATION=
MAKARPTPRRRGNTTVGLATRSQATLFFLFIELLT